MAKCKTEPKPWTEQELNHAKLLERNGYKHSQIAKLLDRATTSVTNKLNPPQPRGFHRIEVARLKAAAELRKAAADRRSPTATFFGDPPPGYSALDERGR